MFHPALLTWAAVTKLVCESPVLMPSPRLFPEDLSPAGVNFVGIDRFQTCSFKDVRLYQASRVVSGIVFRRKTPSRMLRDRGPSFVLQLREEMPSPGPFLQVGASPACGTHRLGGSALLFREADSGERDGIRRVRECLLHQAVDKGLQRSLPYGAPAGHPRPCHASKPELGESCSSWVQTAEESSAFPSGAMLQEGAERAACSPGSCRREVLACKIQNCFPIYGSCS